MKRTLIVFAIVFLLLGTFAICEESVLIDFTLLEQDMVNIAGEGDESVHTKDQNRHTIMNYGAAAGATFTDNQKALMRTSLALENWEVELNSSARNVTSLSLSRVVAAKVRETKPQKNAYGEDEEVDVTVPFKGEKVLGVRVVFPTSNVNANARVVPPFEIPAYEKMAYIDDEGNIAMNEDGQRVDENGDLYTTSTTRFEGGYGVVKNVGTLKSISVTTMGMNYPYALYVLLKDTDNVERRYYMGTLGFDGWKELQWDNPTYITDVRTREIRIYPIYPRGLPFVKFIGFQIVRDAAQAGGDFIGYFKDVKIIYDKAVLTTERDIADEDLWNIVTDREAAKQNFEMTRFGEKQVDRFLEYSKYAQENEFTSSLTADEESEQ
ncbi:MAG: flagellar filament outer layer protein FlaA [Treponemataceae bacterium]|nr:flagellar filament outer layer protein FlaA [Treponemataceae bacterium]